MLLEALLFLTAAAAEVPLHHAVTYQSVVDDPFIYRRGVRYDLRADLGPQLSVGVGAALYPDLGDRDWRASTRRMIEDARVAPHLSRITHEGTVFAEVVPVRNELPGGLTSELRVRLGAGALRTLDDLTTSQTEGSPIWESTATQVHPALETGLYGRVRRGDVALDGGVRRLAYFEVEGGTSMQFKSNLLFQLGVAWSL